jgi:homoserine O-acetyltransferase
MRFITLLFLALPAFAASYPAPVEADWIVRDFRFHTGQTLPKLRLHYRTIGEPSGQPVLILHGSSGNSAGFLNDSFAGVLFGPDQPLDARSHYLILPDTIGNGKSSKPSDEMRAAFPRYTYEDQVRAEYRLVTEHLRIPHLTVVMGSSMGGMHSWMWAEMYPDAMDAVLPLAASPAPLAGRNWMLRSLMIHTIREDPEWNGGNYTKQPSGFVRARQFFNLATGGGTQGLYTSAPTHEKAEAEIVRRLNQPVSEDANDCLYQYDAGRDYNPLPDLEKIRARVLAINSADDERNPPELGLVEQALKRIRNGRYVLIPLGPYGRGHGTASNANLWKKDLAELLSSL